jgi:pyridoxal 4-dehydrogenase
MKMKDRVAIVTGAAQGIGRAIAQKLDAEGATVVVADKNLAGAEKVADGLERGDGVEVDISSEQSANDLISGAVKRHGKIDALVNNAAIVPFIEWEDVDLAHWQQIIGTNLTGTYMVSRAASEPMRSAGYGRIVNVISNTVLAGTPNMAAYVSAKGGVLGFTRALATELGKDGITVNGVAPGLTATEGVEATPHKEAYEFVQQLQAIPRRGEPEDIAPPVAFLCSEEAGWVTGQMIVVDGGHTRN